MQLLPKIPLPQLLLLLQELLLQPQFVAVKSLILVPPHFIYALLYAWEPVNVSGKDLQ